MYSIGLLLLLASVDHPDGAQAVGGRLSRRQNSTPVPVWGVCNYPSQGINGPLPCASGSECICKDDTYAQCREQLDGSWAAESSWQCQQPGDTPSGSPTSSTPSNGDTSSGNPSNGDTSSGTPSNNNTSSGNPSTDDNSSGNGTGTNTNNGDTSSDGVASRAATIGDCTSTSAPGGWDGIASTTFYGWQGSACDCGQNSWQWAGGSGVYNGAVNQKLFQGSLNSGGQPNCGSACGGCYELSTSGFNAYNDGVASGSTITLQIVDACYSNGDHWCGSTSDGYKDTSSCSVHFDIQTGPPGSNGQSPVGADGTTWNGGGQIIYYRQTACPQTLTSGYKSTCTC